MKVFTLQVVLEADLSSYTDPATGEYKKYDTPRRTADLYIFALMKGMITQTSDPLDLDHWEFYHVTREVIDQKFGDRKSVGLKEVKGLTLVSINH